MGEETFITYDQKNRVFGIAAGVAAMMIVALVGVIAYFWIANRNKKEPYMNGLAYGAGQNNVYEEYK